MEVEFVDELMDVYLRDEDITVTEPQLKKLLESTAQEALVALQRMAFARNNYARINDTYRLLCRIAKDFGMDVSTLHPFVLQLFPLVRCSRPLQCCEQLPCCGSWHG